MNQRILFWFSCGSASACNAKLGIEKFGHADSHVVQCDTTKSEDEDNIRFRSDVERWLDHPITIIRSEKYETVDDVIEGRKYISGVKGAPCTVELKKVPRFNFQLADDIHCFGYTSEESDRIAGFERKNPELLLRWLLRDAGMTKDDCHQMIAKAGIAKPLRYLQGFVNNNCKACNKATSLKYWVLTRRVNPVEFWRRAKQSRELGSRMVRMNGVRIFLDEIPPDDQIDPRFLTEPMEDVSCGPACGMEQPELNL